MGPKQLDTGAILEADVTWNVQHMEKLSVSIPLQQSQQPKVYFTLLKKKEKERKTVENCGINTLRAAVSAQLFPAANVSTSGGLFQRGSSVKTELFLRVAGDAAARSPEKRMQGPPGVSSVTSARPRR